MTRRRRWQLIVASFLLGVFALGAALNVGKPDYPPCSPGYHEGSTGNLAYTYGPCTDIWRRHKPACAPLQGTTPRPDPFTLPSCVRNGRA